MRVHLIPCALSGCMKEDNNPLTGDRLRTYGLCWMQLGSPGRPVLQRIGTGD